MSNTYLGTGDSTYAVPQGSAAGETIYGDGLIAHVTSDQHVAISGNDHIEGGDGNDTIVGDVYAIVRGPVPAGPVTEGNDYLAGGAGDDILIGDVHYMTLGVYSVGDDILVGGPGNDTLFGGNYFSNDEPLLGSNVGSDTFVFDFTRAIDTIVTTVVNEVKTSTWVESTITETFDAYLASHNLTRTGLTQSQFSNHYGDWLHSLVARYHDQGLGQDLDGDGKISVGINQNSTSGLPAIEGLSQAQVDAFFDDATSIAIRTGKTSQTRYFSNEFSVTSGEWVDTTITWTDIFKQEVVTGVNSGDGHDTIMDFTSGTDMLQFNGVTQADFLNYFTIAGIDENNDGHDDHTLLTLTGSTEWSVTLMNVTDFDWTTDIRFQDSVAYA